MNANENRRPSRAREIMEAMRGQMNRGDRAARNGRRRLAVMRAERAQAAFEARDAENIGSLNNVDFDALIVVPRDADEAPLQEQDDAQHSLDRTVQVIVGLYDANLLNGGAGQRIAAAPPAGAQVPIALQVPVPAAVAEPVGVPAQQPAAPVVAIAQPAVGAPQAADVAAADRDAALERARANTPKSKNPLAFHNIRATLDGDKIEWISECCIQGGGHIGMAEFRAHDKAAFKTTNVKSHLKTQHANPMPDGYWRALLVPPFADRPTMREIVNRAEADRWSMSQFVENETTLPRDWVQHVYADWKRLDGLGRESIAVAAAAAAVVAANANPAQRRKRQATYEEMAARAAASAAKRPSNLLALYAAIACADGAIPFLAFERDSMRFLIRHINSDDGVLGQLPGRRAIRSACATIFARAVGDMTARLQKAPGFSIAFDVWTSRGNHTSYLGLIFSYVDEDFMPHNDLLCLIPLTAPKQDYMTLAHEIAMRIEHFTTASQFLVGSVTDNGKNVVKASRELITNYGGLLFPRRNADDVAVDWEDDDDVQRDERVLDFVQDVQHHEVMNAAADGAADAADDVIDDDQVGANDDEIARAHQCVDHDFNLCVLDMLKRVELLDVIRNVDAVVAAVNRSSRRQTRLAEIQGVMNVKIRKLQKRGITRWNSLAAELDTVLSSLSPLVVLAHQGAFDDPRVVYELLRRQSDLKDTLRVLEIIAVASRLLEGSTFMTLPHVPFVVHKTIELLSNAVAGETVFGRNARNALLEAVKRRLGKHLRDGTLPTLQAAMLMPCYAPFLRVTMGVTDAALDVACNKMVEWHVLLSPPVARQAQVRNIGPIFVQRIQAPAPEDAFKQLLAELLMDAGEEARATAAAIRVEEALARAAGDQVQAAALAARAVTFDRRVADRLPEFTTAALQAANAKFRTFWTEKTARASVVANVVRMIVSMSAASACVEQVFSGASLLNTPLRTRLAPATLEQLVVLQRYARHYGVEKLKELADR